MAAGPSNQWKGSDTMHGLKELNVQPLKTFEECHLNGQSTHLRGVASTISRLAWEMEMSMLRVRNAETPEAKAAAMTSAMEVSRRVSKEALTLGFNV